MYKKSLFNSPFWWLGQSKTRLDLQSTRCKTVAEIYINMEQGEQEWALRNLKIIIAKLNILLANEWEKFPVEQKFKHIHIFCSSND